MESSTYVWRHYIYQYIATFTGILSIVSIAMHIGWPSPSLPKLLGNTSDISITPSEGGWITAAPSMGSPPGCILAVLLVDRIGRKKSLLVAAPLVFTAWVTVAYATSALLYECARFLAGIANGLVFTVLPMYIGEISDKKVRGLLGSSVQVAYNFGILAVNIIGIQFSIKATALFSSLISVLYFVTFYWAPESPYFLVLKGQNKKATRCLKKLTGMKNVDTEISELAEAITLRSKDSGRFMDLFTDQSNKKALCVAVLLLALQHASGFMAIMFYCFTIFREANGAIEESFATIIYFAVTLITSALSSILVDKTGRRPLLIISVLVAGCALAAQGIYFYLKDKTNVDTTNIGFLPLTALLLCTVSFNIGLTTIPILMLGELFPTNVKAFAICLSNIIFNAIGAVMAKSFQIIKDEYGLYIPFLMFALSCFLGLIFIICCVPETKGKSLEQIQQILKGGNNRKNITGIVISQEKALLNSKPVCSD